MHTPPPVHLAHQRGPLHDLPDTPEAYDAVLADVVDQALRRITPEGNLEHPDCVDDIGDTSLGITSLLALAWQRTKDPRLPEAVRRSLAAVNVLDAADGLVDDEQRTQLLELAHGYWRRLTEATVSVERGGEGLTVRTDAFTAVIGDLAGDAHAEPELTLRR
ncbi:hypothetical protein QFZ76_008897 [Streptomyces sp. V4I2]|nr:hypothetical protein [Streptomyces sp. V4I2]